ncbi:related to TSD2 protein, required for DNA replication [Serendipita indica DSM 11827]|uniref:Related to TSD2 protein, required for DNA replication n=2 Tax=Serendipita indica (strain DSM 11827) TaxID=1109443 RepID=G4TT99_SERID|nr:related to TSD2 protein, required for DNA replication [Serendipita indica DSM 11827]
MYINSSDYREAYQSIVSQHRAASASSILIAVAPDVDALCAASMLATLLHQDNITHRLTPVAGLSAFADLKEELAQKEQLSTLVLINFGAHLDLPSEAWFGAFPENLHVHVIDSSRPYNLSSLFGAGAAERIIVWDDETAPKLTDVKSAWYSLEYEPLPDSDDSDEDEDREEPEPEEYDSDEMERPRKRRRLNDTEAEPKPKRMTEDEYEEYTAILEKYYGSGTFHGQAASSVIYVLATVLERADNDLLWLSILGLTYQYLTSRISRDTYETMHQIYFDEVARLNTSLPANGNANVALHPDDTSIRPSEELRFALFRHWNLYDSMYHSPYVASKLGIWKEKGRKRLHGLLAKMGFSLAQCQQSYSHMDTDLKRELREKMEDIAPEYGLVELSYPSFVRSFGFKSQPLCAADVVDGVSALLEAAGGLRLDVEIEGGRNGGEWFGTGRQWEMRRDDNKENLPVARDGANGKSSALSGTQNEDEHSEDEWWKNNFWVAYDALGNDTELLNSSLRLSMTLQRAVVRQGSSLIEKGEIKRMRNFQLAMLKEGPDLPIFVHPGNLSRLALWLVEATRDRIDPINVTRTKKKVLPFVLACLDERKGTYLVVGVLAAPEMGDLRKNQFGMAFLEAQSRSNARTRHSTFDTNVVEVDKEDLTSFLTKLQI